MPRSFDSSRDGSSADNVITLRPGRTYQSAGAVLGTRGRNIDARKPAVPKTSGRSNDSRKGSSSTGKRSQASYSPESSATACSNGDLAIPVDGVGGVGMIFIPAKNGTLKVKRISKDGPAEQNGMVKVGDTLRSVSGIPISNIPQNQLHDLIMGEPSSTVRLGLERSDKMTGRTFFYEIALQREDGPCDAPGLGEAAAAAVELDLSPKILSNSHRSGNGAQVSCANSSDYLSAQDSKVRTLDNDSTPYTSNLSGFSSRRHEMIESRSVSGDSRQNSARRAQNASPWPTPLSARGLTTVPVDGGEASLPTELSLTLSKSSIDPYSVLHKRNQESMAVMASEIEVLQGQVAAARAEINNMQIRASEADEIAKIEVARRESEEKLRQDALERERLMHQQWAEEQEKRKEAEMIAEDFTNAKLRSEKKIKALEDQVDSLTTAESELKAKIIKLQHDARESSSSAITLEDENKKLTQNLDRFKKELTDAQKDREALQKERDALQRVRAQLKETGKKSEQDHFKMNELQEANRKLQAIVEKTEAHVKKLGADLETLQRKHTSATSELKQKRTHLESSNELVRKGDLQMEKDATEIQRLRTLNDTLEKELEKQHGELQSCHARRKLDRTEIAELRAKLEEMVDEAKSSMTDCQKEKLARTSQEEREKQLQAAIIETEQRRRELDSRLYLLEERRKHDLAEFSELREEHAELQGRLAQSENRLLEAQRLRDSKANENLRLQDQISQELNKMLSSEQECASMKREMSINTDACRKAQADLKEASKTITDRDEQVAHLQLKLDALESELGRLRHANTKLECDLLKEQEKGRDLDSQTGLQKSHFQSMQDKILDLSSQLENEKARRLSAEGRERETRQSFTLSQEALRTLEGKYEMAWQDTQMLTTQLAKVRQEYSVSSAQLKGQTDEIEEAQRLMRDATQMVEMEQARRTAAEDREKSATQTLMSVELEKSELENKVWMLEEKRRLDEASIEQIKASLKLQEEQRKSAVKELDEKTCELEEVKEKSKELASKFQLIGNLRKEFEAAERDRLAVEERFREQDKELEEARELARKTMEVNRELSAKSKEDDAEIERLNLEIVAMQEKRITHQHERLSIERSQENTVKQLRKCLRDAEEGLQMAEMRVRKTEKQKTELEAELAEANRRITALEQHANALLKEGTRYQAGSDNASALCGVGVTFQKSGGGFLVTGLDGSKEAGQDVLCIGDLIIAVNDIPLADMSSIQFRNTIQGPVGTSVSLLVVRQDNSGSSLAPFDLNLTRRPWASPDNIGQNRSPQKSPEQERYDQFVKMKLEEEILMQQQHHQRLKYEQNQQENAQQNAEMERLNDEILALKQKQQRSLPTTPPSPSFAHSSPGQIPGSRRTLLPDEYDKTPVQNITSQSNLILQPTSPQLGPEAATTERNQNASTEFSPPMRRDKRSLSPEAMAQHHSELEQQLDRARAAHRELEDRALSMSPVSLGPDSRAGSRVSTPTSLNSVAGSLQVLPNTSKWSSHRDVDASSLPVSGATTRHDAEEDTGRGAIVTSSQMGLESTVSQSSPSTPDKPTDTGTSKFAPVSTAQSLLPPPPQLLASSPEAEERSGSVTAMVSTSASNSPGARAPSHAVPSAVTTSSPSNTRKDDEQTSSTLASPDTALTTPPLAEKSVASKDSSSPDKNRRGSFPSGISVKERAAQMQAQVNAHSAQATFTRKAFAKVPS